MIFNMSGNGGASLNYKVVGGTSEPSNPKENTIWVNTDTAITSHVFSATEPTSPSEGMAWFNVSASCAAPINVLKKNTLMLYPAAVQQYVGGAWVVKEAKTYQSGAWVDWILYLYDIGNQFERVTGGWVVQNAAGGTSEIRANSIWLAANGSNGRDSTVMTANKINILPVHKTLNMNINITYNTSPWGIQIGLMTYNPGTSADGKYEVYKKIITDTGQYTLSVDISSVSGEYYVVLFASVAEGDVSKVWVE